MTIRVNIGEAKLPLPKLVAAARRGEEVIIQKNGKPQVKLAPLDEQVKLVPLEERSRAEREAIVKRRMAAVGMFREQFKGHDLSIEALRGDRPDPDERERRALGPDS